MNTSEIRSRIAEVRSVVDDDGRPCAEGYAIVWGEISDCVLYDSRRGQYRERVARGAFDESLNDPDQEIVCRAQHTDMQILSRRSEGTLSIRSDDHGVWFRSNIPPTSYGEDLRANLDARNIKGCSFGMRRAEAEWEMQSDGIWLRTITGGELFEVSPVVDPCYAGTEVALRSLDQAISENNRKWLDLARCRINLADKAYLD